MTLQLSISFDSDKTFGGQLKRLYELLQQRPVTCEDAQQLGIAGSAFARRIKDLRKYNVPVKIGKKDYVRSFDGKKVKISEYSISEK